jgi:hypothetical protein
MIRLVEVVCVAAALFIAVFDLRRRTLPPDRQCVFCGTMLTPPLYQCAHVIGDGRAADTAPDTVWR